MINLRQKLSYASVNFIRKVPISPGGSLVRMIIIIDQILLHSWGFYIMLLKSKGGLIFRTLRSEIGMASFSNRHLTLSIYDEHNKCKFYKLSINLVVVERFYTIFTLFVVPFAIRLSNTTRKNLSTYDINTLLHGKCEVISRYMYDLS